MTFASLELTPFAISKGACLTLPLVRALGRTRTTYAQRDRGYLEGNRGKGGGTGKRSMLGIAPPLLRAHGHTHTQREKGGGKREGGKRERGGREKGGAKREGGKRERGGVKEGGIAIERSSFP